MKKRTLTFTLALLSTLALAGCKRAPQDKTTVIAKGTVAMQATTALTMTGGFTESPSMRALQRKMAASVAPEDIPVATLDVLMSSGNDFTTVSKESDRAEYEYLDEVSFSILDEEKIEYSLYYNLFEKTDNDDDDDDDDDIPSVTEASSSDDSSSSQDNSDETSDTSDTTDTSDDESSEDVVFAKALLDDEDDVEIETLYKMEGIAVVGENEYPFRAKAEHEVETDETETELIFALWKDDANYIVIRQEIEIEGTEGQPDYEYEEKFHYYVVTDGQVTRDFFLEFENEDSELELEIIIDGLKYEVEYVEEDGKLYIDIKIDGDETYRFEKVVTVDEETNEVTVTYNYIT